MFKKLLQKLRSKEITRLKGQRDYENKCKFDYALHCEDLGMRLDYYRDRTLKLEGIIKECDTCKASICEEKCN